jgi:hypothetical protein
MRDKRWKATLLVVNRRRRRRWNFLSGGVSNGRPSSCSGFCAARRWRGVA